MSGLETIFSIEHAAIRFGRGALAETGQEARALDLRRVLLVTDPQVRRLPAFATVQAALAEAGVEAVVFDRVAVEPTDTAMLDAARAAAEAAVDGFVSLGGGSAMDTAKAANLLSTYPAPITDYVSAPAGRAVPVPGPLKPHIACPTTFGTGAETTGILIVDLTEEEVKTGVVSRRIRPTLGILDPGTLETLPGSVIAANGFDVLSHAIESFTARPFHERPAPATASARPLSQGANPYSAFAALEAVQLVAANLETAVRHRDPAALEQLAFAGLLAGVGFGNAGCHLPHAMSYPVAALVRDWRPEGWVTDGPMVPHGIAVAVNAPSALRWAGRAQPGRFAPVAAALGARETADPGDAVADALLGLMTRTGLPVNLARMGFTSADIPTLAEGAARQRRLTDNAPLPPAISDFEAMYREALIQG
ncbi:MAG: iron-containing alcohol dehydrogenase [Magnetospirillum sp.]|nr:iron-containing alcohol dehydrogenase [Magnetospirillum sp.]